MKLTKSQITGAVIILAAILAFIFVRTYVL